MYPHKPPSQATHGGTTHTGAELYLHGGGIHQGWDILQAGSGAASCREITAALNDVLYAAQFRALTVAPTSGAPITAAPTTSPSPVPIVNTVADCGRHHVACAGQLGSPYQGSGITCPAPGGNPNGRCVCVGPYHCRGARASTCMTHHTSIIGGSGEEKRCQGPMLTWFSAPPLCHAAHTVGCSLLRAHSHWMLNGACNRMACLIAVFRDRGPRVLRRRA